jgi:UDP-N-acetylglucosamine/UDP-N-acetylgalactosamine diphosphorylase
MTSSQNDLDVREFFKKNKNFGVKDENLFFFPQGEICALDNDGKILLENPKKIFKAPDGNGGCLLALKKHGIIDECIKRGIEYINIMAIDNPLYKLMDPLFIGTTISKGKNGKDQMGAKYIKKTDPEQKVGYFLIYKDKPMMLDYMEMPEKLKYAKMDNGDLVYNAANILDYLISVSFLKKAMYEEENIKQLLNSFHHIKKKMNCVVYNNEKNIFEEKNNYEFNKYEMFLNSIFEFSNKDGLLLLEIEEMDEFAPVKNDETKDKCTAATARLQISNLCKKWFKANGGTILNDSPTKYLEISFLVSYDGNDLFDNKDIPKTIDFKDIKEGEGIYIKNKDLE